MSSKSLIEIFLQFPSQIKLYHWQTRKYPRHKASDSLFSEIQTLIDDFIETYQGKYQRIYLEKGGAIPIYDLDDVSVCEYIKEFVSFLQRDIFEIIKESDTDLVNIRDEMLSLLNQTLYLFTLE